MLLLLRKAGGLVALRHLLAGSDHQVVSVFDPATYLWSLGPNMAAGRWYPTVTALNNGEMLITSGRVNVPEVRTTAGGLRARNVGDAAASGAH